MASGLARGGAASAAAILSAPAAAPVASRSLAEARQRARYFFRALAREIPWILRNYQLEEVTTRAALRSQLAQHFRSTATENAKVIDIMLFKGQAEAHEVLAHHYQRHHLITRYVAPKGSSLGTAAGEAKAAERSAWFHRFLKSNATDAAAL